MSERPAKPAFICLVVDHDDDADPDAQTVICVNVNKIVKVERTRDVSTNYTWKTFIYIIDEDHPIQVKESLEEVVSALNAVANVVPSDFCFDETDE